MDSEQLHFDAYKQMCAKRGISLKWDEVQYAKFALYSADGLKKALLKEYEQLQDVPWERLYAEKKACYQELLAKRVDLMPGVTPFLEMLQGFPTCVVTNSARVQIEAIKDMHPILQTIPRWITREDYGKPKPDPECYEFASKGAKRVIGFEDSPRGLSALLGAGAEGILVTSVLPTEEIERLPGTFGHVKSFHSLLP
ncbi:MAG: hypothetical protein S4CHLAM81_11650 [Chlamydiales bacterium]|nr:hypothetical protein [Chlamydiales bacterium]MCH9635941.1 hypothetical protein [Chlamydiales bacterium]